MKIKCNCGFQGTLKVENGLGKCFGCQTLYQFNDEGEVVPVPDELPEFKSWDEMVKFSKGLPTGGKVRKPKRSHKSKPAEQPEVISSAVAKPELIFFTVNFYTRPGQDWQSVMRMAKEERNNRGQTVLVSAHNHVLNEECTHLCHSLPVGDEQ